MAEKKIPDQPISPEQLRRRLDDSDADLIAECEVHLYRASGPGGQHRNKVVSGVRLVHRPSGLHATATERRSQHENRANALKRLRHAIALAARVALPAEIRWPETVGVREGRIRVNESNAGFDHAAALILDAFVQHAGNPANAAHALGLTTSSFVRFLAAHPTVWREAAAIRERMGMPKLQPPR